jgi:hypothetical protein
MKDETKNIKKKIAGFFLFAIFITLFLFVNFVSAREIDCIRDNPVLLWHFDEGSGINAQDSCSNINATLYGDMIWDNGKYGNAVRFNGVNTYVDAGNIYPFNQNMPEFSFSLWVNFSNPEVPTWQTLFRSGYYNPLSEFIEAIQINEGDNDYVLFMGSNSIGIKHIDCGIWHNIVGTFNGTSQTSKLYIDGDFISETFLGISEITATTSTLYFGFNFDNGFLLNGTLDEIAFFNRTLSQEEVSDISRDYNITNCSALKQNLILPTYPYVEVNTTYPLEYYLQYAGSKFQINSVSIDINEQGNHTIFNMPYNPITQSYSTSFIFTQEGNYPFVIFNQPNLPCITNITGTFIVRKPYNITFCGFNQKDGTSYVNDFAYLTAEFTSAKKYYDTTLEQFITPLGFATTFKTPVFHTTYRNGCGTLKLYEANEEYAIRLFDGDATFQATFSPPNITKTYGTNIFLGKYTFNGSDDSMRVLFSDKDIRPYFWLFNWIYIIALAGSLIVSVFVFFAIPDKPAVSLVFATIFIVGLTITRIVIWLYLG